MKGATLTAPQDIEFTPCPDLKGYRLNSNEKRLRQHRLTGTPHQLGQSQAWQDTKWVYPTPPCSKDYTPTTFHESIRTIRIIREVNSSSPKAARQSALLPTIVSSIGKQYRNTLSGWVSGYPTEMICYAGEFCCNSCPTLLTFFEIFDKGVVGQHEMKMTTQNVCNTERVDDFTGDHSLAYTSLSGYQGMSLIRSVSVIVP